MLLIYKKANEYKSIVACNENKDYFQRSFNTYEMELIFTSTLATNIQKTANKNTINKQVKVRPIDEGPVCTDWFWITSLEDAYGNIIEVVSVTY